MPRGWPWAALPYSSDNAHPAFFAAHTINPDCPLENIIAMYEAVRDRAGLLAMI